jgi:hypothetical protein
MANATIDRKWAQMGGSERAVWFGKFLIAMCTFGFAFPQIMDPLLKD